MPAHSPQHAILKPGGGGVSRDIVRPKLPPPRPGFGGKTSVFPRPKPKPKPLGGVAAAVRGAGAGVQRSQPLPDLDLSNASDQGYVSDKLGPNYDAHNERLAKLMHTQLAKNSPEQQRHIERLGKLPHIDKAMVEMHLANLQRQSQQQAASRRGGGGTVGAVKPLQARPVGNEVLNVLKPKPWKPGPNTMPNLPTGNRRGAVGMSEDPVSALKLRLDRRERSKLRQKLLAAAIPAGIKATLLAKLPAVQFADSGREVPSVSVREVVQFGYRLGANDPAADSRMLGATVGGSAGLLGATKALGSVSHLLPNVLGGVVGPIGIAAAGYGAGKLGYEAVKAAQREAATNRWLASKRQDALRRGFEGLEEHGTGGARSSEPLEGIETSEPAEEVDRELLKAIHANYLHHRDHGNPDRAEYFADILRKHGVQFSEDADAYGKTLHRRFPGMFRALHTQPWPPSMTGAKPPPRPFSE